MGYLGEDVKKLGFGLMRLPRKNEEIDIEQVKDMVDAFMEVGFTYFDTAWAYPGSEEAARKALVERYPREKFLLATKNAAWINCKTREDAICQFETSLEQSGAGYFDFYLLHNLGAPRTKVFDDFDMWNFVKEKKEEGLIKHIGFSFHSTPQELEEILKNHPEMEFVQLQINYADWENNSILSRANYEMARKYNKPVIIMEPVKGGLLANPPEEVKKVLKAEEATASPASWAVRFSANLDGVITVLSGMSDMEQMQDNLSYMKNFEKLTKQQEETIEKAQKILNSIPLIPCTSCNYCAKVCPMNIGISGSFTAMNTLTLYKNENSAMRDIDWNITRQGKKYAKDCIQCGKCEQVCPQHILIREELVKVAESFEKIKA